MERKNTTIALSDLVVRIPCAALTPDPASSRKRSLTCSVLQSIYSACCSSDKTLSQSGGGLSVYLAAMAACADWKGLSEHVAASGEPGSGPLDCDCVSDVHCLLTTLEDLRSVVTLAEFARVCKCVGGLVPVQEDCGTVKLCRLPAGVSFGPCEASTGEVVGDSVRVLYDCPEVRICRNFKASKGGSGVLKVEACGCSVQVVHCDEDYKEECPAWKCRMHGELCMEKRKYSWALNWWRRGEYNSRRNDEGGAIERHAQGATLRAMGEHGLARKFWLEGREVYRESLDIEGEVKRILAYEGGRGAGGASAGAAKGAVNVRALRNKFVYVSESELVPLQGCRDIISRCEKHCKVQGWTTKRHYAVPTRLERKTGNTFESQM